MRTCENCYYGSFNLSERGEELYCAEPGFPEEPVDTSDCCDDHIYYPGTEEENNCVFYDESYIAPGFLIVNYKAGKMSKFLKFYKASKEGFPLFSIRAYSTEAKEGPEEAFSSIDFTFRKIEDDENGLSELFSILCADLQGKKVPSIDCSTHGNNNLEVTSTERTIKITLHKDTYHGTQHPCNYIDILLGDDCTCDKYDAFSKFWQGLSNLSARHISPEEARQLTLTK